MSALAALRHRNFRLLWSALLVSFTGSNLQMAVVLWHVSLLAPEGRKGITLGAVGLARFIPLLLFCLPGGAVADAVDRRRLLFVTQSIMGLSAAGLAVLTFTGHATLFQIYALSALSAAAGAFDGPARQAIIPNLVPRADLPNAMSLNVLMFQIAAVTGPALAGLVIAGPGLGWAYLVNAVSFGAVIVALLLLRDVPASGGAGMGGVSRAAVLEGLRFTFSQPLIRSTMLLDFVATFFSSATMLLPLFAQDVLFVGPRGYGLLSAAPGIGSAVAGVIMVSMQRRVVRRGLVVLWSVTGYAIATIGFGMSRSFALTLACLALVGATDTVSAVLRNIIRQTLTPDRLRGRMTSVNMVFFIGGPQLGEFEAGALANLVGAPLSVISGGVACLVAVAWTAFRTPELVAYRADEEVVRAPS
jgi:MFS family permease